VAVTLSSRNGRNSKPSRRKVTFGRRLEMASSLPTVEKLRREVSAEMGALADRARRLEDRIVLSPADSARGRRMQVRGYATVVRRVEDALRDEQTCYARARQLGWNPENPDVDYLLGRSLLGQERGEGR
jgi:hypothetical protein